MKTHNPRTVLLPLVVALGSTGCLDVLGFMDPTEDPCAPDGCSGTGGQTGSTTGTASGGGSSSSTSGTGAASSGGAGTGGATTGGSGTGGTPIMCEPNATESCYGGPEGTEGVGLCRAGTHACNPEGDGWGPCEGEVTPSPEACGNETDEDCNEISCGKPSWAKSLGDEGEDAVSALAMTPGGNLLVAGFFAKTIDVTGTPLSNAGSDQDGFIAEVDPSGNGQWIKQLASDGFASVATISTVPDGILVGGRYGKSLSFGSTTLSAATVGQFGFVAKLSGTGDHLWSREFGSTQGPNPYCEVSGAVRNAFGDVFVIGSFSGTVDFGNSTLVAGTPYPDIFLLKLNGATGATAWAKQFGTPTSIEYGRGIATDLSGNLVLSGVFSDGTFNFGSEDVIPAPPGSFGVFVTKLTFNGDELWTHGAGTVGSAAPNGLALDTEGGAVVTGYFSGGIDLDGVGDLGTHTSAGQSDIFVARYNANGDFDWSKSFGSTDYETATSVTVDGGGDITVAGVHTGAIDFGNDPIAAPNVGVFWASFGQDGTYKSSHSYSTSGAGVNIVTSMATPTDVFLGGQFFSGINWGWMVETPVPTLGGEAFLARLTR